MRVPSLLYGAFVLSATAVSARALPVDTVAKRHPVGTDGSCAVQPAGYGPVPSPDTPDAFESDPDFANAANGATTPSGYDLVAKNQLSAIQQQGAAYITYEELKSYDVAYCAAQCDTAYPGCESFNIYYERDPTVDPAAACPNPPSLTRIKCAFFTGCSNTGELTNNGQYCQQFHIVIAGSNVYNKDSGCSASTTPSLPSTTPSLLSTTPVAPSTTPKVSTTPAAPSTTPKVSTTPAAPSTTPAAPSTTPKATTPATTVPTTTKATTTATPCPTGGPKPSGPQPGGPQPGGPQPGGPQPGGPQPGGPQPGGPKPNGPQPGGPQPGGPQPGGPQPGGPKPNGPQPGGPQGGWPQGGWPQGGNNGKNGWGGW